MRCTNNVACLALLTTTSCAAWRQVPKDQLPLIAISFETEESVEVQIDEDISVDVDPTLFFRMGSDDRGCCNHEWQLERRLGHWLRA